MRHPRFSSSLFVVLGLLAMLAMPLTATAGGPAKKSPAASKAASKKKVDPARSAAAKKGWETRRMNQKAEANWASRVSKNPAADTPGAREAFVKRSVASQKSWQKRKAATASASKPTAKAKKVKTGKTSKAKKKVAAAPSKKSKNKKVAGKTARKGKDAGAAAAGTEEGMIENAGVGNAGFRTALAKFEEAAFAQGEGRALDAAIAQMEGHDAMAQAAFDTADEYEAAGRTEEAARLNDFGESHLAKGDAIEAAVEQQQAQAEATATADRPSRPSAVRRFFSRLNPLNWGKNRNDTRTADNGQFQFD